MSTSGYHITISNIRDDGFQLFHNNLILYHDKPMPETIFKQKIEQLRYITVTANGADNTGKKTDNQSENTGKNPKTPTIIGYIQSHPMMYSNVEYLAIEEIEIFEPYRKLKYGSEVINVLQLHHQLIIIDIQEYALGFWLHVLGKSYWNKLASNVELLIASCSYSGKVADYFRTTYSNII